MGYFSVVCFVVATVYLTLLWSRCNGQFPRVCVQNLTSHSPVCCPTPNGFNEPCGGPVRGRCEYIQPITEDFSPVYSKLAQDDRLDWPRRFFKHACKCAPNYMGYMCHECQFGYSGENCDEKTIIRRKNALHLTEEEKVNFKNALLASKLAKSEYVILKNVFDQDPMTNPTFLDTSVYDLFTYLHNYASRDTMINGSQTVCMGARYDTSHKGAGFLSWHRYFMLLWERETQKLVDYAVSFPYWDWTNSTDTCDVCTNDLIGKINSSDTKGTLDQNSIFHSWNAICQGELGLCRVCDITKPTEPLHRPLGTISATLPVDQMIYTMEQMEFDVPPYSHYSQSGFRNALEGFVSAEGISLDTEQLYMHNQVHAFIGGQMAFTPISPSDPIFILHHVFVDKLYEDWIAMNGIKRAQLPIRGAPMGHNRPSRLVPFFPPVTYEEILLPTISFGYTYDVRDEAEGTNRKLSLKEKGVVSLTVKDEGKGETTRITTAHVVGILFVGIGGILLIVMVVKRRYFRNTKVQNIKSLQSNRTGDLPQGGALLDTENHETTPLLSHSGTRAANYN